MRSNLIGGPGNYRQEHITERLRNYFKETFGITEELQRREAFDSHSCPMRRSPVTPSPKKTEKRWRRDATEYEEFNGSTFLDVKACSPGEENSKNELALFSMPTNHLTAQFLLSPWKKVFISLN